MIFLSEFDPRMRSQSLATLDPSRNEFQVNLFVPWDLGAMWPNTNRQMSTKVAQKMISLENWYIQPLQKLPKNVRDLGKLIATKGFKKLPKVQ